MLITLDFEKENRSNFLISSAEIRILFAAQDLHLEEDTKGILRDNYSKRVLQYQYFLKLDDATSTEIITGQTQLKSAYNFYVSMGINYSFGSIYNNVVNVRFQGIY